MKSTKHFRTRIGVLVSALALVAVGSVPLLGTAQDTATPSGGAEESLVQEGQNIYENVCIACHQPGGVGIEGIYPQLNGNPLITGEDPTYLISTVLTGRGGMPSFAGTYDDEEIAAISTYVRQAWDNDVGPVDASQVEEIREKLYPTEDEGLGTQDEEIEATPMATPDEQQDQQEQDEATTGQAAGTPEATP